ncbi:helix-turn-helix domain-containing protein [Streptomyces sp. NEAU-Y11]|uniref:helix-turn-helix domain-containing protein n=1 Tax=Streptomyces cucumeris TaxID=2962890 RepID=UPI0035ABED98
MNLKQWNTAFRENWLDPVLFRTASRSQQGRASGVRAEVSEVWAQRCTDLGGDDGGSVAPCCRVTVDGIGAEPQPAAADRDVLADLLRAPRRSPGSGDQPPAKRPDPLPETIGSHCTVPQWSPACVRGHHLLRLAGPLPLPGDHDTTRPCAERTDRPAFLWPAEPSIRKRVLPDAAYEAAGCARVFADKRSGRIRPPADHDARADPTRTRPVDPSGQPVTSIAKLLDVSRTTLYKYVPELKAGRTSLVPGPEDQNLPARGAKPGTSAGGSRQ